MDEVVRYAIVIVCILCVVRILDPWGWVRLFRTDPQVVMLRARLAVMRAALDVYADPVNWDDSHFLGTNNPTAVADAALEGRSLEEVQRMARTLTDRVE